MTEAAEPHTQECGFCRIVAGEAEASFVYRDERVVAFMDTTPVTPGHLLVIPIAHAEYLSDLEPADGARVFEVAQRAVPAGARPQMGCVAAMRVAAEPDRRMR